MSKLIGNVATTRFTYIPVIVKNCVLVKAGNSFYRRPLQTVPTTMKCYWATVRHCSLKSKPHDYIVKGKWKNIHDVFACECGKVFPRISYAHDHFEKYAEYKSSIPIRNTSSVLEIKVNKPVQRFSARPQKDCVVNEHCITDISHRNTWNNQVALETFRLTKKITPSMYPKIAKLLKMSEDQVEHHIKLHEDLFGESDSPVLEYITVKVREQANQIWNGMVKD